MSIGRLGRFTTTETVARYAKENYDFSHFVAVSFDRYCNKDWGDLCDEDKEANDNAVKFENDRIVAEYKLPDAAWTENLINRYGGKDNKIWIITEWDRSATTILFPGEY